VNKSNRVDRIVTAIQEVMLAGPRFDWQPLLTRQLPVIDVPGRHSTMLQEPNVEAMALRLTELLEGDVLLGPAHDRQTAVPG
jgi:thioesterase domain-containing protein